MKVLKYVITNVKPENQRDVEEVLITLVQKGIIKTNDIHFREEDENVWKLEQKCK